MLCICLLLTTLASGNGVVTAKRNGFPPKNSFLPWFRGGNNRRMPTRIIGLDDILPGDIVLFPPERTGDWAGKIIALLTGEPVTHAAMVYRTTSEIIEMRWDKEGGENLAVMPADEERFGGYQITINRLKNVTPENLPMPVLDVADKFRDANDPFGWSNIILLAILLLTRKVAITPVDYYLVKLLQFITPKVVDYINMLKFGKEPSPMTCSQFVSLCYDNAGGGYELQFVDPVIPVLFQSRSKKRDDPSILNGDSILAKVLLRVSNDDFIPKKKSKPQKQKSRSIDDLVPAEVVPAEDELDTTLEDLYHVLNNTIDKPQKKKRSEKSSSQTIEPEEETTEGVSDELAQAVCDFASALSGMNPYPAPSSCSVSKETCNGFVSKEDTVQALAALNNNVFVTPGDLLNRADNLYTVGNIEIPER